MDAAPRLAQLGLTQEALPAGTHVCQIFNEAEERNEALATFLEAGLRQGERAACILSDRLDPAMLAACLDKHGLNLDALRADATLRLLGAREFYFREGGFDPEQPLALIRQIHEKARNTGHTARVIGEVCAEVGQVEGGRPLVAYERRVGQLVREQGILAVCQYDAADFNGATIMDVLGVHPVMMVRGEVIHNPFFLATAPSSEDAADARALGQLLLIESLLPHLPSRASMLGFTVRGLEGLPGVRKAWFQDGAAGPEQAGRHAFEIRCGGLCHAVLHLAVTDEARFSRYVPHIKNLAFMFGVVLNERLQREENDRTRAHLEALVAARTVALAESEGRARAMLRTALDGIWLVDDQDRLLEVNDAVCAMLGYRRRELIGMKAGQIGLQDAQAQLGRIRQQGSRLFESRQRRKDGTAFPVEVSGTFHPDRGQIVLFVRDITERRQAETLLLQDFESRCALERQAAEARRMESLGRLAGGVAHDMNNVLGAILALASSHLETCPERSPFHGDLDTIAKAALRGGHLVKGLLAFARQAPLAEAEVDLNAVLQEVVRLLERTLPARIRLVSVPAPGLRPLRGDAHSLADAVMNLCLNAVDAMAGGGTLTLCTHNLDDGGIQLQVQDTGSGMTAEIRRRALEPFFTTKGVGRGTGLGLAMVYGTVQAHHGQLTLESEPGAGTCVLLAFPACAPAAPVPVPEPASPGVAVEAGCRVLLVDDDPLVRSATQALLDRLGHRTTAVAGGEEALAQFGRGGRPEVVVLDLNMPGLSGAETLARLRALDPEVPVILATGSPDEAAHALLASFPGVSLLAKPYALAELRHEVQAAVAAARSKG